MSDLSPERARVIKSNIAICHKEDLPVTFKGRLSETFDKTYISKNFDVIILRTKTVPMQFGLIASNNYQING